MAARGFKPRVTLQSIIGAILYLAATTFLLTRSLRRLETKLVELVRQLALEERDQPAAGR